MEDVHGYLLVFVIVAFTIAISTLFLVGYKPKELNNKFDKQGTVKYVDSDY